MIRKLSLSLGLLLVIITINSGCAVNRATATLDPGTDLAAIESIYVKRFAPDQRELDLLIAAKLKELGYQASTGPDMPSDVDAVITYVDKWMWDITNYMIELTVYLRDPETDFPLATGNSYHTSLSRRSPEEMVDEVITNIFKQRFSDVQ